MLSVKSLLLPFTAVLFYRTCALRTTREINMLALNDTKYFSYYIDDFKGHNVTEDHSDPSVIRGHHTANDSNGAKATNYSSDPSGTKVNFTTNDPTYHNTASKLINFLLKPLTLVRTIIKFVSVQIISRLKPNGTLFFR